VTGDWLCHWEDDGTHGGIKLSEGIFFFFLRFWRSKTNTRLYQNYKALIAASLHASVFVRLREREQRNHSAAEELDL
jgi:hypothetical protein